MSRPVLLAISGSLRRHSYSTAILLALRDAAAEGAEVRLHPLADVPLYNEDLDTQSPPEGVAALRLAVSAADGIIIATAEYNHGLPGVLKNALDWVSRPYGRCAMTGKAAYTISSSPGAVGGARSHAQLNETLLSIGVHIVLGPQAVVAGVQRKIVDGRLDEATASFLLSGLDNLLRDAVRLGSADRQAA